MFGESRFAKVLQLNPIQDFIRKSIQSGLQFL